MKESLDTQIKRMITTYPYDLDLKNAIDLVQERVILAYIYYINFQNIGVQFNYNLSCPRNALVVYYSLRLIGI